MKTKAIVREEVWQHDQEQSRRSRKTSWCVLGIAKVSQRDTMLSFTAGVRAASTCFCQNLSRA